MQLERTFYNLHLQSLPTHTKLHASSQISGTTSFHDAGQTHTYQGLDTREWNELIHQKLDFKKFGIGYPTHPLTNLGGRRECLGVGGQRGGRLGLPAPTSVGLLEARGKGSQQWKIQLREVKGTGLRNLVPDKGGLRSFKKFCTLRAPTSSKEGKGGSRKWREVTGR